MGIAVTLPALTGCASRNNYSYAKIEKEYARYFIADSSPKGYDNAVAEYDFSQPISLSEAVRIALVSNPDSRMAMARIKQATAIVKQSQSSFYPTLNFFTEYLQGDTPSAYLFKTIDQRALEPGTDFNNPGWFQNWESGFGARMNLYSGGRDSLNNKISQSGLTITHYDRQAVENTLVASVIQTYFDCLAARAFVEIANESVASVNEQLRVMRVKFEAGGALKSDLLSLEVRLAQAQEEVVRSNNRLKTLLAALANLMGVRPDAEISLSDADLKSVPIPPAIESGIEFALDHRPDLQKVHEKVVQSRMAVDLAGTGYMPEVDFFGRWFVADANLNYDLDRHNWTAAFLLNWDFFDGFSTRADKKKAKATLEELLAVDRKTVLAVRLDVKNAYLNMDEARARFDVARKSVDNAEESLKLVKMQYEGGSATITRFLEAELDRNRSKIRATAAYYDNQKALFEIGRAIGYWNTVEKTLKGLE